MKQQFRHVAPLLFAIGVLLLASAAAHGAPCERKYSSHHRGNSGGWHHRRK